MSTTEADILTCIGEGSKASHVTAIPVRNLWYMLLYAWNEIQTLGSWKSDVESAPTLDVLLAKLLIRLVQQRMRVGLGRDYRNHQGLVRGVRGRVDFVGSLRRLAFENGQAFCRYHTFSANVPKNQIVRSTITRLAQVGCFDEGGPAAGELRSQLRRVAAQLFNVELIELEPSAVQRECQRRHDGDYRLMLRICLLLCQREMPTEETGTASTPWLDRNHLVPWRIFERFVANFYSLRLVGWKVMPQAPLHWHETEGAPYLPGMCPDIILLHKTGKQILVMDTKFYKNTLSPGQWGGWSFHRDHLYQLYAYLRTQESLSKAHRTAAGVLLYPMVNRRLSERVVIQGHRFCWETIDLTQPWQRIEKRLLDLVANCAEGV